SLSKFNTLLSQLLRRRLFWSVTASFGRSSDMFVSRVFLPHCALSESQVASKVRRISPPDEGFWKNHKRPSINLVLPTPLGPAKTTTSDKASAANNCMGGIFCAEIEESRIIW